MQQSLCRPLLTLRTGTSNKRCIFSRLERLADFYTASHTYSLRKLVVLFGKRLPEGSH